MFSTDRLMTALTDGDDSLVHMFPPKEGVRPQAFVDAAVRALEAVRDGTSEKLDRFPDVGVAGTI